MAEHAELASCNDALTGERAISRIARDTCIEFGATLDNWQARVRLYWPFLCGAELLIRRYRSECFQLVEPEWMEPAAFGGDPGCERLPGLPHGLTRYEDGWRCYRCGAQPFWPLHYCWQAHAQLSELGKYQLRGGALERTWPHLCENFPDETPEVLYWLGEACWGGP